MKVKAMVCVIILALLLSLVGCVGGGSSSSGGTLRTGTCTHCHGSRVDNFGKSCTWCNGTGVWAFYD